MIIVKLYGGLGNQMFQYALGRTLSLKHETDLYFDCSYYKRHRKEKELIIDQFNIDFRIATDEEYNKLTGRNKGWILWKAQNQLKKLQEYYKRPFICERLNGFDGNILKVCNNSVLDGYWQSPLYFQEIEDTIRNDFKLRLEPENKNFESVKENILTSNSVAVHVRRGDYLDLNIPVCGEGYYLLALKNMRALYSDIIFFIFSDDIEWCKNNIFKDENEVQYIAREYGFSAAEELILMSRCKHQIIANSTFSWWSAWLNNDTNKIVIYPENIIRVLNQDLMFKEWKCL